MRDSVIFRFHGGLTARHGCFALRNGGLTPLHFALGGAVRGLRKARRANEGEADKSETEGNKENQDSGQLPKKANLR